MPITAEIKGLFFDTAKVAKMVDKGRRKALSRQGAYVRTAARTRVLRRRKRVSRPGQPPSIRSNDKTATLKNILFTYEPASDAVVVGPLKVHTGGSKPVNATVPQVLEFGGQVRRRVRGKKRRTNIRPRPFMSVALEQEIAAGNLPAAWRGAVNSG